MIGAGALMAPASIFRLVHDAVAAIKAFATPHQSCFFIRNGKTQQDIKQILSWKALLTRVGQLALVLLIVFLAHYYVMWPSR